VQLDHRCAFGRTCHSPEEAAGSLPWCQQNPDSIDRAYGLVLFSRTVVAANNVWHLVQETVAIMMAMKTPAALLDASLDIYVKIVRVVLGGLFRTHKSYKADDDDDVSVEPHGDAGAVVELV
jgi:hypothetical protein